MAGHGGSVVAGVTEWLQPMLAALTKFYSGRAWAAGDARRISGAAPVSEAMVPGRSNSYEVVTPLGEAMAENRRQ